MTNKIHLAGTGCCLMDYLYTQVDFEGATFRSAMSRRAGDGGLRPGALVFSEDFERFVGRPFPAWLAELTGGRAPDAANLGGPAIVSLMHAAQMLVDEPVRISFHAGHGDDETGDRMRAIIGGTAVQISGYRRLSGPSPSTVVLSDPRHHDGKGERTFINTMGAARSFAPEMLDETFFGADVRLFGATALLPAVHDRLSELLARAKRAGGVNVVGTVYDFRNEQRHPGEPWPLGRSRDSYPLIDLLVCDHEEALKLSGCGEVGESVRHFLDGGVGSVVVTHGARGFHLASRGGLFARQALRSLPVCKAIDEELERVGRQAGDTTGCGDNFLGGVLASLLWQRLAGRTGDLDLIEACAWGAASGGFACFYKGGTFQEPAPGFKRSRVEAYVQAYRRQLAKL